MAEYSPMHISELIQGLEEGSIILPAMQRNFVWSEDKICGLFDSIMRDYPIGTFLFWPVKKEALSNYAFNAFIRDYDEQLGKNQRGNPVTADFTSYTAVLDGQQRITSLYMGVKGKYHTHKKGKQRNNPDNYYDRFLCLDIMSAPRTEEDKYQFAFQPEDRIGHLENDENGRTQYWYRVSDVFNETSIADLMMTIQDMPPEEFPYESRKDAMKMLTALHGGLHSRQNINYYSAKEKNLADVVDIFVRVNSGGQKLDSSDLMLSVAAGEQGNTDIHRLIEDAVNEINNAPQVVDEGFKVDKELILTAGLLFTKAENISLRNSKNYTKDRMNEIFKDHWEAIVGALKCAVEYIEYLGFAGKKIGKNYILPIAYYFYKNQLDNSHIGSTSNRADCDMVFIRQWLLRAMFNGLFFEGTPQTLLSIRKVIDIASEEKTHFPLEDLMRLEVKKPLKIEDEQIEDMLELQYGDPRIRPLFNELEHKAARANDQVDHIWARAILSSKRAIKKLDPMLSEKDVERYQDQLNKLANLQLLDALENKQKSEKPFDKWLKGFYRDEEVDNYRRDHFIPGDVSYAFDAFLEFIDAREVLLREKIKKAFPSDFNSLVEMYALQDEV